VTKSIYLTTPIYYINARPHIGHAYTTILCDVVRRFYRLLGYDTYFLTGTDEHGDKILQAALENNIEVEKHAEQVSALFKNIWPTLNIETDDFIRTTEDRHKKVVQDVLQRIFDKGEIYHASYGGHYCTGCERFYTEKELVDGKCPEHLKEPVWIEEENYFFKMSKYQEWLIDHIKNNPDFIRPERYRNEMLSFLKEPLKDLCISRPVSRLPWGIPLPFDEKYVTYVWFDALVNYISAMEFPDGEKFKHYWPVVNHFIAKDILKPHAIYWPCMLKAADIDPYLHLNVHGWWNMDKQKMSKSLGNVVEPLELSEKYGVDAFRYFLLKDMSFGLDADFSETNLIHRFNSDLANDFGNLVSRVSKMICKYCDGIIPESGEAEEFEKALISELESVKSRMEVLLNNLKFNELLESIMSVIRSTNKYVNDTAPWTLAKDNNISRLNTVLNISASITAGCAQMLFPVMPERCAEVFKTFGLEKINENSTETESLSGKKIVEIEGLFPRINTKKEKKNKARPEVKEKKKEEAKDSSLIEYSDFTKLQLKTAKILSAERVPDTDKLMKLELEVGEEKRQIVAGIAKDYAPEDLPGNTIIIVANLKPRKLRGLESNGMLLAAHGDEGLSLITVDHPTKSGASVS
jgi:methionyl-tRNA synthetase